MTKDDDVGVRGCSVVLRQCLHQETVTVHLLKLKILVFIWALFCHILHNSLMILIKLIVIHYHAGGCSLHFAPSFCKVTLATGVV